MSANPPPRFATTRWSMVLAASKRVGRASGGAEPKFKSDEDGALSEASFGVVSDASDGDGQSALETLCRLYWPPLYAFALRRGASVADAQDLTQEFFTYLLQSDFLGNADADRGRFRTFLLTVFERFAASEWRKESAAKRGGGVTKLRLDFEGLDRGGDSVIEPASSSVSPAQLFQQQWAMTLLGQVVERLRDEYRGRDSSHLFEALESQWNPGAVGETPTFEEVAERLGMTAGAVKVAAHRLRSRYRTVLRQLVSETLADPADVEDEIRDLMNSFSDSV